MERIRWIQKPRGRRGLWVGVLKGHQFTLRVSTLGNLGGCCASYTAQVEGCQERYVGGIHGGLRRAYVLGIEEVRRQVEVLDLRGPGRLVGGGA